MFRVDISIQLNIMKNKNFLMNNCIDTFCVKKHFSKRINERFQENVIILGHVCLEGRDTSVINK
jgi:hypothetical protein